MLQFLVPLALGVVPFFAAMFVSASASASVLATKPLFEQTNNQLRGCPVFANTHLEAIISGGKLAFFARPRRRRVAQSVGRPTDWLRQIFKWRAPIIRLVALDGSFE